MNKNVIVTIMTGFDPSYRFVLKTFQNYAERVGADLKVIDSAQVKLCNLRSFDFSKIAWAQKLKLNELLKQYERVLYLDGDIVVHSNAPDIFKECSDVKKVYMFNEGLLVQRNKEYNEIFSVLGEVPIPEIQGKKVYFNAGVILFSRESDFLSQVKFSEVEDICQKINFYEQTYFNYILFKNHFNVGFLDDKYNRTILSGPKENRLESYFIHHAGGAYSSRSKFRFMTVIQDAKLLYKLNFSINDYLYISGATLMFYLRRYLKKLFS